MEDNVADIVAAIEGEEESKQAKPMHEESDDDVNDVTEFVNRYTVDLIAEYQDTGDNLLVHWGIAKKTAGEWARGDDSTLPNGSIRWPDNVATQSPFVKDLFYPEFRSL